MRGLSEKRVKITAWLLFALVFIVYMLNADRVHYALSGKSYAAKLPDAFSLHAKGNLNVQVSDDDTYLVNNKFVEGAGFRGFIAAGANTSGTAKVRVFFRSSDAVYEVIENRHSFWGDPMKNSINFFASTAALEKGVYSIGLRLTDDGGERFVWLHSFFEKAVDGPVEYIARPAPPLVATRRSKDLKFALEQIDKIENKKRVCLKGWVALENAEMEDYNAYIVIWNSNYIAVRDSNNVVKTFYAPLFTRMDIASRYANPCAANSGFLITIPRSECGPGKHAVKVLVKSRKTGEIIESEQTETGNF